MSAKWRALQHRHRYTYSAVVFPQSYIESLNQLPSDISSLNFFKELNQLISLNSIYAQVTALNQATAAFGEFLSGNRGHASVSVASQFFVEILFLENSLPLHRSVISLLAKHRGFSAVIGSCFQSLCEKYGALGRKGKRFLVSRATLSLLSYPKLGFFNEYIERCAILVALDVRFGMQAIVSEIKEGSRPSPVVMEQCQEAMSCLYYLLQRFPSKFVNAKCSEIHLVPKALTVFEIVVKVILSVLKSLAFSRDCLVAAGVSFCAALQACLSPQELAVFTVEGLFHQPGCNYTLCDKSEAVDSVLKMPLCEGDLYSELRDFSVLSRLCILRGVLTAIPRTVLNMHFFESRDNLNGLDIHLPDGNSIWTILFNGILPELCNFCENPVDSHFNFHALTVTQICLQQIKTSILANLTDFSRNYEPFPENVVSRLLRIIWNNLEDQLNQTVKQVHLIFDLLLDIQSTRSANVSERMESFSRNIASNLLRLGARCKGRYVPLASLTKRLGAMTVLDMSPNLLFETIYAYIDDDVCCATTSFLKCFLECLRDECWSSEGIEKGYVAFRRFCLLPLLHGLVSGTSKLRTNLNTYALPVFLEVDVDSIFPMLAFISVGQSGEDGVISYPELSGFNITPAIDQCVAALVSLLKVSRSLALIEGDIDWYHDSATHREANGVHWRSSSNLALVSIKGVNVKIPVEWLVLALTHVDDTLRIDAAESLFINPKTSSLPSPLELSLMKEAVPLNMRSCSTAFQMKWTSLFRKFFSRVRTALERQVKQGHWQPLASSSWKDVIDNDMRRLAIQRAEDLFRFTKWLSCFLFFSCYPSAPYERKTMAMELILVMINVWPILSPPYRDSTSISPTSCPCPYARGITLPDSTLSLVGSIIDSWDRLRQSSFLILSHFPTPLPGISSHDTVKEVILWAKRLVCSPRVRESDAGALTLRLMFRKYVLELGWFIGVSVNVVCLQPQAELINRDSRIFKFGVPVIEYILSLVEWLCVVVEEGEKDLTEACQNSFVHGILLTLRYTFEELNWNSDLVLSNSNGMKHALEKLLELVMRITSLALWVVSADAWYLPEDMDDVVDDGSFLSDVPVEMEPPESSSELQVKNPQITDDARSTEQVVMVGCWLAMKEVSFILGTIIRKIPLSSCTPDLSEPKDSLDEATDVCPIMMSDTVLDLKQLETIGNHFLEVLLKMKHNGAIDKTRAGFTALCNRLLCSNDPRLCKMTESWMEQLMERTVAKNQTVDDLLRRSAGIPAAFIALFLSEPEGTPKKLLPQALRWLIDVAKSLSNQCEIAHQNGELSIKNSSRMLNQTPPCALASERGVSASKLRDEGVIPTVHAFNVLRAAFNDTNLAADTSGFSAEALIISILSFSSPYWEVRNSACLAYTALVRRMIGFLNVQKRESARRALTGLEFFHRYPALHSFLLSELKIATDSLGDGYSQCSESNMGKVVHPSLCPVLIILSRLKPSTISSETEDALDPFVFMPFIKKCATQSNLRVRVLASRALTGLISNEKLQTVLHIIAGGLPHGTNQMANLEGAGLTSFNSNNSINGVGNEMPRVSFNSIHGILLQLIALVDTNCRNLIDVSKKDQILGDLIQVLMKCSWIGNIRSCHCPTLSVAYMQLSDHMLGIAKSCGMSRHVITIQNLLLELSKQCLDIEVSHPLSFYDPTSVELRRQAASSYFNCMLAGSLEAAQDVLTIDASTRPVPNLLNMPEVEPGLQERLMFCISDSSYEIRLATLKWLLQFLKLAGSGGKDLDVINSWAKTSLQPTIIRLLAVEENPKCTHYILRILFAWNMLQFEKLGHLESNETVYIGNMDGDSLLSFWDKLTSLRKTSRHIKAQETLVCCMGICVKQFARLFTSFLLNHPNRGEDLVGSNQPDGLERWGDIYNCIVFFINLIKQNGASSEPVNMRRAAAESMVASGLLEQVVSISSLVTSNQIPSDECIFKELKQKPHFEPSKAVDLYARLMLDLWFTCVQLLEDEDVGLRQRLAMEIQRCLDSKGTEESRTCVVPTQVEKVIELSFEFLSSLFGHWVEYFNFLATWVLEMGSCVIARGDLVRRIFDKEIDNHHEERLLICQICCFHLEKLSLSSSWAKGLNECDIGIFLQKWKTRFLHQLILFAKDYIGNEGGTDWIGGLGNHKDTFVWLYANLLGLYALSKSPSDKFSSSTETNIGKPLQSDFLELRRVLPFLRNPLISNLYLLVVRSYESMLDIALSPPESNSQGDLGWEGFNPYFLR